MPLPVGPVLFAIVVLYLVWPQVEVSPTTLRDYSNTQWSCSAPGSLWKMLDSISGAHPVQYQWATTSSPMSQHISTNEPPHQWSTTCDLSSNEPPHVTHLPMSTTSLTNDPSHLFSNEPPHLYQWATTSLTNEPPHLLSYSNKKWVGEFLSGMAVSVCRHHWA